MTKMGGQPVYDVVVIGAGFGGLYAIHRLRQLGLSICGFERAEDVGGVWHWNRYPGARCDRESYIYSYSFSQELEQDWNWSLKFSEQGEILDYLRHVADRFDLRRNIRFSTQVKSMLYDAEQNLWRVETDNAGTVMARYVVSAAGALSVIQRQNFPGLEGFKGAVHHTGAWPTPSPDLRGKRVGVIGTGSSGVQTITALAPIAEHLTVFQRSAAWVIPALNEPVSREFDDWVKANYGEIREKGRRGPGGSPFYHDGMTSALEDTPGEREATYRRLWNMGGSRFFSDSYSDLMTNPESNETAAEFIRDRIREAVKDPDTARKLTPRYRVGTKRPAIQDGYYETFNRDNVTLVDLMDEPIQNFYEHGIRTSRDHELDVVILATGFDAVTGALLAMDIRGLEGANLSKHWADGPRSFLGLGVAGYPNLFTITGPLSPAVLANVPTCVEQHVDWIADCISYMRSNGLNYIEATEEAESAWADHATTVAEATLWPETKSWYSGDNVPGKPRAFSAYVGGFHNYKASCDQVAQNGYQGFKVASVNAGYANLMNNGSSDTDVSFDLA